MSIRSVVFMIATMIIMVVPFNSASTQSFEQIGEVYQDEDVINAQPEAVQEEVETEGGMSIRSSAVRLREDEIVSRIYLPMLMTPSQTRVTYQGDLGAQAADIAILAKETGFSTEKVESAILFQQAFAEYADDVLARYPEQISAIWTDVVPSQKGHILFTGDVPAEVMTDITERSQLVQSSSAQHSIALTNDNVVLAGGGELSMSEHLRRSELAAEALVNQGYQNAVTFYDPRTQVTNIELQISEEASPPSQLDIVGAVQERVWSELSSSSQAPSQVRAASVKPQDIKLTVSRGDGPIVQPAHSRGGNWVRDDGVRECTSGWSVSGPNGNGIITAGHCTGLNQFEQPGVTPYSMRWRRQVYNSQGDVEYHTTSHWELAEFYANATSIRNVRSIRATNTMVGNSVCVYGRSSNVRTCNHSVQAVGVTVLADGSVSVGNLARASNNSVIGGDSGGGWSWGTTAWGVTHGFDGAGRSYFTPVQQAQTALGVTILTK